jgi:hypothetical protein
MPVNTVKLQLDGTRNRCPLTIGFWDGPPRKGEAGLLFFANEKTQRKLTCNQGQYLFLPFERSGKNVSGKCA